MANGLSRFGRAGLALSSPSALSSMAAQEQQQRFEMEREGVRAQQGREDVLAQTALQILQKAEPGSAARALAISTLKQVGYEDTRLFEAMKGAPSAPRQTKVVGGSLVSIGPEGETAKEIFRAPEAEQKRDPLFGRSQSGMAMDVMLRAKSKLRRGEELTPEDRDALVMARRIMTAPRVIQGPGGALMQVDPVGIPEDFDDLFQAPGTVAPEERTLSQQVRSGDVSVRTLRPGGNFQQDFQSILSTADSIADLLNEGEKEFGGVTGVVGTGKAMFGGVARQIGLPVSTRAKQLDRQLELLKAQAVRYVLGESGRALSDADRRRLDKIAGQLDVFTDAQDIREVVSSVIEIVGRADPSGQQNQP